MEEKSDPVKFQSASQSVNRTDMANLRKSLAKLTHLITFEAASRSANFTRASEELGVTRVSVSRRIAELEAAVGTRLFHRDHRKVRLTQAGRVLEADVNPALHQIAAALDRVSASVRERRLAITTTSAFATYWLMPRLVDFKDRYPDIDLNLVVSDRYLDLEDGEIDIAIRYTKSPPLSGQVRALLQECVFPVVSPKYQARTKLRHPADLLDEYLLNLSGIYRPGARWPSWFRQNGIEPPPQMHGVIMNTYINMLQAAIEGQGVALAGTPLVDPYLVDGRLRKIDGMLEVPRDYFYLVSMAAGRADADGFCAWIRQQVA